MTSTLQYKQRGKWYPSDPEKLKTLIKSYLAAVQVESNSKKIEAIIVPHAGYQYSGQTAAYAYKSLSTARPIEKIFILAPSHHYPLQNKIAIPQALSYSTPLQSSELAEDSLNNLAKHSLVLQGDQYFENEHSIDNQIPFLQYLFPKAKLVPIIVGNLNAPGRQDLARIIAQEKTAKSLIVVSSDFTHYGKSFDYQPFKENVEKQLEKQNLETAQLIEKHDSQGFEEYLKKGQDTICGANPILLLLEILPQDMRAQLLFRTTSASLTGDYSHSVSYLSFSFFNSSKLIEALSEEEKKQLLKIARENLENYFKNEKTLDPREIKNVPPRFQQRTAVFVTLSIQEELRGCIGEILAQGTLLEAVLKRSIDAAIHDPRFPPLKINELVKIKIEISVLSPPQKVASWQEIKIGKHGIILKNDGHSAVFLPQVATEQAWDLETTLMHLSLKAGLTSDAWKKNTSFEVFEAEHFSE